MALGSGNTDVAGIVAEIVQQAHDSERIVFVSGNFNVVHPGHLRLLNFAAECGDFLVVGVTGDDVPGALIPEHLRLEGVKAISAVSFAFLLPVPAEEFVASLKPHMVVKGKEHEAHFNPEQSVIESYGASCFSVPARRGFRPWICCSANFMNPIFPRSASPSTSRFVINSIAEASLI